MIKHFLRQQIHRFPHKVPRTLCLLILPLQHRFHSRHLDHTPRIQQRISHITMIQQHERLIPIPFIHILIMDLHLTATKLGRNRPPQHDILPEQRSLPHLPRDHDPIHIPVPKSIRTHMLRRGRTQIPMHGKRCVRVQIRSSHITGTTGKKHAPHDTFLRLKPITVKPLPVHKPRLAEKIKIHPFIGHLHNIQALIRSHGKSQFPCLHLISTKACCCTLLKSHLSHICHLLHTSHFFHQISVHLPLPFLYSKNPRHPGTSALSCYVTVHCVSSSTLRDAQIWSIPLHIALAASGFCFASRSIPLRKTPPGTLAVNSTSVTPLLPIRKNISRPFPSPSSSYSALPWR